jgi:hypothetical protein
LYRHAILENSVKDSVILALFMVDWLTANRLRVPLKAVAKSLKILDTSNSTGLVQKQTSQAEFSTIEGY